MAAEGVAGYVLYAVAEVAFVETPFLPHEAYEVALADTFVAVDLALRQRCCEDWQAAVIARFRDSVHGRWLFFNPRRKVFHATPEEMEYQVAWELEHLEAADLILMNLLGSGKSPVSLLELGLHARSGRLRVACEPDYYRYDNVRITCRHYGIPLYDSFDELLEHLAGENN